MPIEIEGHTLTVHASTRMAERQLTLTDLEATLAYGREVHTRGITIYVLGHKEIENAREASVNLSRFEGVHVLCSREGEIVTAYRNRNLRGLRPRRRTRSDRFVCPRAGV